MTVLFGSVCVFYTFRQHAANCGHRAATVGLESGRLLKPIFENLIGVQQSHDVTCGSADD